MHRNLWQLGAGLDRAHAFTYTPIIPPNLSERYFNQNALSWPLPTQGPPQGPRAPLFTCEMRVILTESVCKDCWPPTPYALPSYKAQRDVSQARWRPTHDLKGRLKE